MALLLFEYGLGKLGKWGKSSKCLTISISYIVLQTGEKRFFFPTKMGKMGIFQWIDGQT
jgi:hypothetical protein